MIELLRHIRACNNAVLPGGRHAVLIQRERVGWITPGLAQQAATYGAQLDAAGLHVAGSALPALVRALADAGALVWRGEAFDVRARPDGPVLAQIDRGALPRFGIAAAGVHVNGLVGDRVWVGRRAADKLLDPGKLDHLVAGGVPAGMTVTATLLKEAEEEAGLPAALAGRAVPVGTIAYAMEREEGLRRDVLHCFDLELPPDFRPHPNDDEVEDFELWPFERVLETMRSSDAFKFNVNLVLIDLLLRRGVITGPDAASLRQALDAGRIG